MVSWTWDSRSGTLSFEETDKVRTGRVAAVEQGRLKEKLSTKSGKERERTNRNPITPPSGYLVLILA